MWPEILAFIGGAVLTALAAWLIGLRFFHRQAERQRRLLERTRRAEKLAEFGTLTGHLAHEIRNPLSTIKVNLRLLGEDIENLNKQFKEMELQNGIEDLENRFQRQMRKINSVTREMDRVTDTLNDFLRFAGRLELHTADHDVNELVDDLVDFYEPQAISRQIQIRRSLSPEPAISRIDVSLLKQSLLNLFINASQVMDEGGELMVRTGMRADRVIIEVIDTGPGIPPEDQEKVFDPYYTTRAGGTGLGLPTCRRIVEEHGGQIDLYSEPGKGTRFVIELPKKADEETSK